MTLSTAQLLIAKFCYSIGLICSGFPIIFGLLKIYNIHLSSNRITKQFPVIAYIKNGDGPLFHLVVNMGTEDAFRPICIPQARAWKQEIGESVEVSFHKNNPTELRVVPSRKERICFGIVQIGIGVLVAIFCLISLL